MMKSCQHLGYAALLLGALAACGGDKKDKDQGGAAGDGSVEDLSVWPSYGHDGKNTRFNAEEKRISRENVATLVKKWDTATSGVTPLAVTSTVAVTGGVAYFGDWGGMLHAIDAKTGAQVWKTQLARNTTGLDAQINASPFVTDDRVYIGGVENQVFAVERATGMKIWEPYALAGNQANVILWSSPNVVDNTLIIGVGSTEVFLGNESTFSFRGNLVMMDASSGTVQHTTYVTNGDDTSGFGCSIWGSAAIDPERQLAYVGVGQSYSAPASALSDAVIAVDYTTGEIRWGHQFTPDDIWTISGGDGEDWDVGASVVLYESNGKSLVGAGDKAGNFYALDRDTGAMVWITDLTPGGKTGGVMASPAVADGVIYVFSNDGIAENYGSDGPGSGSAFALNGETGQILWRTEIKPGAFGGIAVANGLMFFTTLDGTIYALNTDDGAVLWQNKMLDGNATKAAGGVTVAGGMVYAGAGWDWVAIAPPPGGVTAYALPGD